ncbi:glycoside hydrolase family 2 TIM barrel-domain containing protein [Cohnella sp. JJ-181]|uniref:glycoside hydrolase family 2 TIM barrel-domain containing protein n=1 Tax=Cohnella rhizoplanae TaxID=2974897 RepID=UPI0022FF510D|nr:glycoside hydrolase family 2 TIM barrel-domain containing protein [Cohnella sp. JJ-181]CAI6050602.1 hypothetical protein COHCIP112018_01461 [Cohnella sp. JJ-181]
MLTRIGLEGTWELQLDANKEGLRQPLGDTMTLPGTTSYARKGQRNELVETGTLTDEYKFEGYAWFSREVDIPEALDGVACTLYLERTRVTTVWVDGREIGTQNSLCTPHLHEIGGLTSGKHRITIRVDNTDYPTKGGHMTSRDTQTNWNGITGRIELQFYGTAYLHDVQVYPEPRDKSVTIRAQVIGTPEGSLSVSAASVHGGSGDSAETVSYAVRAGEVVARYELGEDAKLWSDSEPHLYRLTLRLTGGDQRVDTYETLFGLREFKADGDKFAINGAKTFLRGKHDGLIFPRTGFAPTTVEEWLDVLGTAKSYGINHYRFHTCCPPEAAFTAADMLGIYMEPELPFWGTITEEGDEKHDQAEQDYLIEEGFRILRAFGNHPSFVMMSLGNELWGSKSTLSRILKAYKTYDDRHLYTQGSNNFQFVPVILEEEDFFTGVRFSRDRLFRGSYAMCDAPLGHVQTDRPGTMRDYDEQIVPARKPYGTDGTTTDGGTIQIQYGTEARTVKADAAGEELIPHLPVVSHEIGQYAMYPRFGEIEKYTGPLKARNFETFRDRLEAKGMGHLADRFFESSGQLAVACYKEELEAAFRSKRLAGFQLLDLQDFSGQGTALVGILDAFMDAKGLISPEEWRRYCSDAVLLGRFEKYNYVAGEPFSAAVELAYFRPSPLRSVQLTWSLAAGQRVIAGGQLEAAAEAGMAYIGVGEIALDMPDVTEMTKVHLTMAIAGTDIAKSYDLWIYPKGVDADADLAGVHLFHSLSAEALVLLERGANVLIMAKTDDLSHTIEGTYCTDFWCYPMFRSISESMNKPVPVGTLGLFIDHAHPALQRFPSEAHSTYPWWSIVMRSRSFILDDMPRELQPIVQTIDNFERNHKLGLLFECRVLNGSVVVCALDAAAVAETPEGRQFLRSLARYVRSEQCQPSVRLEVSQLGRLLG